METGEDIVPEGAPEEEQIVVATLLDDFLEKEGIVSALRQRVSNLERFRAQYLELSQRPAETGPDTQLQAELEQIEAQSQATIDEQAQTILKLERQILEINGCQSVLESEVDRLTEDLETLRSQPPETIEVVKEVEVHADPQPSSEDASESTDSTDESDVVAGLRDEVSQAMDMAFGAMRSNADLGGVIHLLTRSFECSSTKELGKLVLDSISNYNLDGVVAFPHGTKREFFSTGKEVSKKDQERIEKMTPADVATETNNELLLYTDYCQLLISGLDKQDFKAFNDIKDTLRMLVTGVNAGARRVISEISATKERANLERLVMTTQKNLQNIEAKQRKEVSQISGLATATIASIKSQLSKLPGDQEKKNMLVNYVSQELVKIEKVVKEATLVDEGFKKVISALTISLAKQKSGSR